MSTLRKIIRSFFKNKLYAVLFFSILFFVSVFVLFYKTFILLIFIAIGAFSLIHTIITRNHIGFELVTLVTIVSSMAYGAATGAIVGVASIVLGLILGKNMDAGIAVSVAGFILIAVVASMFKFSDILVIGIILTIVYDVMQIVFYSLAGSSLFTIFSYFVTHVLINAFVFVSLAPTFIGLVTT